MSKYRSSKRRPRKKKNNKKKIIALLAFFAIVTVIIVGYILLGTNNSTKNSNENSNLSQMKVLLATNMGNITIQLRNDMPITTTNFKNLVTQDVYDNTIFHRVVNIPGSLQIIQSGDPTGTGYGDPSIPNIQDEFSITPENNKNERGTIAMANTGDPDSGSSQFFINVAYNSHLDNLHPVFGEVIVGMNVVDSISNVNTDNEGRPLEDITIIRASLTD